VNCTQIENEGVQLIASALETNSTLTSLSLSGNSISQEGAEALSQVLSKNTTLETLNLAGNNLGVEGARLLSSSLLVSTSLTSLNLSRNQLYNKGTRFLSDALHSNKTVKHLYLENNRIGDDGAEGLAEALQKNSNLKTLDLGNNTIAKVGVRSLITALEANTTLTVLKLQDNVGWKDVKEVIKPLLARNIGISSKATDSPTSLPSAPSPPKSQGWTLPHTKTCEEDTVLSFQCSKTTSNRPYSALSIQGGSPAEALLSGLILTEIEDICSQPICELFDFIGGSLVGGLLGSFVSFLLSSFLLLPLLPPLFSSTLFTSTSPVLILLFLSFFSFAFTLLSPSLLPFF
jgi:hypothetical protein